MVNAIVAHSSEYENVRTAFLLGATATVPPRKDEK